LRCVRSVCWGVLFHKKFKSLYGILWCGFSFKMLQPFAFCKQ
jgi:hypothetical protein